MNTVWLIEMWNPRRNGWEPTASAALTQAEARKVCREWHRANPYRELFEVGG